MQVEFVIVLENFSLCLTLTYRMNGLGLYIIYISVPDDRGG